MTGTDLEKKVKGATSAENWPTPQSQLYEIAQATHDYAGYREVMPLLWKRMHEAGSQWRITYKCLVLLESLIKHGSERVINETQDRSYELRNFLEFRLMEGEKDRGSGIREKTKEILDLLKDTDRLKAERDKAAANKDKYVGVSNSGTMSGYGGSGSGGGYGGRSGGGGGGSSRYDDDRDRRSGYDRDERGGSGDYGYGGDERGNSYASNGQEQNGSTNNTKCRHSHSH